MSRTCGVCDKEVNQWVTNTNMCFDCNAATWRKKKELDPTKPVQLRDGSRARVVATDAKIQLTDLCPLIVLVENGYNGGEYVACLPADGRISKKGQDARDLINVPEKKRHDCFSCGFRCTEDADGVLRLRECKSGYEVVALACPICGAKGG